ncbi:MAG: glycine oxidase ThiO [Chloroflexi bacterium]|nr:glycine oxidase ThiO [Chloroflexota bacterium]
MTSSPPVVIVGAGVIGCATACELGRRGVPSLVLDAAAEPGEASRAAAGMLSPPSETALPAPLYELGLASLRLFADLAPDLKERTGIDVGYRILGKLRLALSEAEVPELRAAANWQAKVGWPRTWLEGQALADAEPQAARAVAGILSQVEGQVNPARLLAALRSAATGMGARFQTGVQVTGLVGDGGRVRGVVSATGERYAGDQVVLAAGAWTGAMGRWCGQEWPLEPVRGQIAALEMLPLPVQRPVFGPHGFALPRDGLVLVGSTVERAGFDPRVTVEGLESVLSTGQGLVPALAGASYRTSWAGLRPGTADGRPLLGAVGGWEGLFVATGHFRSGIVLAPITAQIMADLICDGRTNVDLEPFSPVRFSAQTLRRS